MGDYGDYAVDMKRIVKRFGSVVANDDIDFAAKNGEIHALLGENGAGKSTIMSILSGVYRADDGEIHIRGKQEQIRSPKDAMKLGIGMVHQHFRLVAGMTAAENIVLGERGSIWRGGAWMSKKLQELEELCEKFGLSIPLSRPIWQLSVGEQQRVEIVKTLYRGAQIIILDEPTSVLTPGEADELFRTLRAMKADGKTVIITTHKLKEVMAVADVMSIMRKGTMIASVLKEETSEEELARLMVGRTLETVMINRKRNISGTALSVTDLHVNADNGRKALDGLTFDVGRGEIVGVAGVAGNGQKELAEALTGLRAWQSAGRVTYDEFDLQKPSVRKLIEHGVAHIPENRMKSGLAGSLDVVDNLLFKSYRSSLRSKFGFLLRKPNRLWSDGLVSEYEVKTAGLDTPVRMLSGGNQQKLVLAREAEQKPKLMVAVHPTQGLDVGATMSVQQMLCDLSDGGAGILLISEDLDEILKLADRILVLFNGRIQEEFIAGDFDRSRIGLAMAGIDERGGEAV
ncbi:ABC transporter ATP-binding protein [Paenibacillus agricola]|uniref:ABC transporter ATP-binding protein n=1 Tax=Paenibacillus agricola TaxID=2716264 RepID=A0ABX0J5V3_9BACL|nr:ABC transporter ATP-binding protein [Paenibacillus agricola]NHN31023.1 ABC transporter ATP-binding protein [Paenibacillus agricola]